MSMDGLLSWLSSANPLDVTAIVVAVGFAVTGAFWGISGSVGNPLALVCAFLAAWFARAPLFGLLKNPLTVFVLLTVGGVILYLVLRKLFSAIISIVVRQPLDSVLGALFGLLKVYLILAIAHTFGLLQFSDHVRRFFEQDTVSARLIAPVVRHFGGQ